MRPSGRRRGPDAIVPSEILAGAAALIGAALAIGAICADQAWFDRHFLPVFFVSRARMVFGETAARLAVGVLGVVLMLAARPIARHAAARTPSAWAAGVMRIALALSLAVVGSEGMLRLSYPRAREEAPPSQEPLRRRDARLGWVFVPARAGRQVVAGHVIDYAFDAHGDRVADVAHPVDPLRPTILFTGESIMSGYGLRWEQSIPALVGARLRLQTANLAVFGYADDQAYLRLARETARFTRPSAVVILFSPSLLFRDLDTDRPHLEPGLIWRPASPRWRLDALARFYVPYHSRHDIDRLIALVRAELAASVRLARDRHAAALIVVPRFGPEDDVERGLRRRILDDAALPYVQVELDPAWRMAGDPHPDARGARAIATAIADRLSQPVSN